MPEYEIKWTLEKWFKATITADNEDEAQEKFWEGEHSTPIVYGEEIQDGIDIEEIE